MANNQNYKSNFTLYFLTLLGYLIWGICLLLLPKPTEGSVNYIAIIGLAPLTVFFWTLFKCYRAEANEDHLILKNISTKITLPWSEIVSLQSSIKFPILRVRHLKIITKTGKTYRFVLDRPKNRIIGIPLESKTPMETFIYKKLQMMVD